MELKDNMGAFLAQFGRRADKVIEAMKVGIVDGLRSFEGQNIVKNQLSGRKSANYGLNVGSGNARSGWVIKKWDAGKDFTATLGLLKSAWYLQVHQHHNFDGYIRPKNGQWLFFKVNSTTTRVSKAGNKRVERTSNFVKVREVFIPKRLYITEEFNTEGHEMIQKAVNHRIREALAA